MLRNVCVFLVNNSIFSLAMASILFGQGLSLCAEELYKTTTTTKKGWHFGNADYTFIRYEPSTMIPCPFQDIS